MFKRFSPRARQVIVLSQQHSRDLGDVQLGTEHLLLGLLTTGWSAAASVTADVLVAAGVEASAARARATTLTSVESVPVGQDLQVTYPFDEHLPFTDTATRTVELAARNSVQLSHDTVEPGHLVLGLLDQPDGNALRILLGLDIAIPALRQPILDTLAGHSPAADSATTPAATACPDSPLSGSRPPPEHTFSPDATAAGPPSSPVERPLMQWLRQTRQGALVRPEYLAVLNTAGRAGGDQHVPPPPDEVLVSWHRELARLRTTRLQSELGFLDATVRAGWPEASIAQALALPSGVTVAEHRERLEADREHQHPSRHPHPWTG